MRRAVFLDRDGTLNREVHYLANPEQLELLPGVASGLARLAQDGWLLCVVTNQSGVARGIVSPPALTEIHARLGQLLAARGVNLDWIGYCPHHPQHGPPDLRRDCDCRKPKPGLLLQAAEELNIDLAASWMIGDSTRDVQAGAAAGCRSLLVQTGAEDQAIPAEQDSRTRVVPNFEVAVDRILKDRSPEAP